MTRKTKILCTIGPAVSSREMLFQLAQNGMDVARLNFSHGEHSEFARLIRDLREISVQLKKPIGILSDIQGPKIRVAKLEGGQLPLEKGEEVWMTSEPGVLGGKRDGYKLIPVGYREFVKDVPPHSTILLDDGLMSLKVLERDSRGLRCKVVDGGLLKNNKGINVPEAPFSALAITEKDYADILFSVEQKVDFIALSFVRTAQEVRHLKSFIESRQSRIQVISKIEKPDALTNLDEIIDASDGILVARGDLAVEVGNERVPALQKKMVRQCNLRGKTAIIATQMLMSMVENPRPSRAEASDVANSVLDGTDTVMLSNETAVGQYPMEAVRMMGRIAEEMESETPPSPILFNEWKLPAATQTAMALLQTAVRLSSVVEAKALVVMTQSGRSAVLVSKCRPGSRIIAVTGSRETYQQLSLTWGVEAIYMDDMEQLISQTSVFESIGDRLLALNLVGSGDKIVVTAGLPRLAHGSTNTIKLHTV